jgi:hypothetical protein
MLYNIFIQGTTKDKLTKNVVTICISMYYDIFVTN